jgi:hypothetical protein
MLVAAVTLHAHARDSRFDERPSLQTLVAFPRALHLPAPAPARVAHPHAT